VHFKINQGSSREFDGLESLIRSTSSTGIGSSVSTWRACLVRISGTDSQCS